MKMYYKRKSRIQIFQPIKKTGKLNGKDTPNVKGDNKVNKVNGKALGGVITGANRAHSGK